MTRSIFVVGMPRSGTSLITDIIRRWGADVGAPDDLLAADAFNPRGYWEYLPLKRFNDALLASIGANERLPPDPFAPTALWARADDAAWRAAAEAAIAPLLATGGVWVVKDPRLRMLLPFWTRIQPELACLVMLRHPLDLAHSLQRLVSAHVPAATYPVSAILLEWQSAMLSILQATAERPATLFVEYEQLIHDPAATCVRLDRWLAAYCRVAPADPPRLAAMIDAVTPSLYHQRSSARTADAPLLTPEQQALYAVLSSKAQNATSVHDPAAFPLYAGWREYLQVVDTLFQRTLGGEQPARNWHDAIGEQAAAR
jgi:hypothetical protein